MPVGLPRDARGAFGLRRDGERHGAEGGRCRAETDRPVLRQPARGEARAQHEARAFLAHEAVADHQHPLGGGPDVVAVAHAAPAGGGVDRLGPLPGWRRQRRDRVHQREVARVAGAQQHLRHVQREVSVQPGVDHVLVEGAVHEAALEQELDAVEQARVVRRAELGRVAARERADRAGVEAAVGRCGHGRAPEPLRAGVEAAIDRRGERVGGRGEFPARVGVLSREQGGGRAQARHAPEVVPVVVVVRPEVLGAEAGREQSGVRRVQRVVEALAHDPARAALDGLAPFIRQGPACHVAEALQDPQHLAVGVPFAFLRAEIAERRLPLREARERPFGALREPRAEQRVDDERGVAEPEALVGERPRVDVVGRVQHQRGEGGVVEELVARLGTGELAATAARGGPGIGGECGRTGGGERYGRGDLGAAAGLDREQRRRGDHPHVAYARGLVVEVREVDVHVARAIVGDVVPHGGGAEAHLLRVVHRPAAAVGGQRDAVDEAHALGIAGSQRQHQRGPRLAARAQPQPADRPARFELHPRAALEGQPRHPGVGDDAHAVVHLLALPAIGGPRGQQAAAVVREQPAVERPAVEQRRQQAARIDDRQLGAVRVADRGPVAVGEVDVRDRERARYERRVARIELALDPPGPDPVQVVLHDAAVDEAAGVEHHACAQQLDRLADLGGLGEAAQPREQRDRVEEALLARDAADHEAPRQPFHPAHGVLLPADRAAPAQSVPAAACALAIAPWM